MRSSVGIGRDQRRELEPPVLPVGHRRHDEDPDAAGAVIAAGRPRCRPGRARSAPGPLPGRPPGRGARSPRRSRPGRGCAAAADRGSWPRSTVSAVDAAAGRFPVLDRRHVGDRRAQHRQGPAGDVAGAAAAGPVQRASAAGRPGPAPRRGGRTVPSASRTAGPEHDRRRRRARTPSRAGPGRRSCRPGSTPPSRRRWRPRGSAGRCRRSPACPAARTPARRHAFGDAEVLAEDDLAVDGRGRPADGGGDDPVDAGRGAVGRLAEDRRRHPAAQPAGGVRADDRGGVRRRARGGRRRRGG